MSALGHKLTLTVSGAWFLTDSWSGGHHEPATETQNGEIGEKEKRRDSAFLRRCACGLQQ